MKIEIVQDQVVLRKELGFFGAASIVVGTIIGSGIFVSPKGVLQNTGSVGLCLVVWTLAGIISLGSALCYAELGAMISVSGGNYTYIKLGLGRVVAFIYVAQELFVRSALSKVIRLLTFSKYTTSILPLCGSPVLLEKLIAATTLVTVVMVNCYSSRLATRLSVLTTMGKVAALCIICVSGVILISQGSLAELDSGFDGTKSDPGSIAVAFYNAIYAYSGAGSINCLVEEVKSPAKTIPRAILTGISFVIFIYVLTNVSYLAVMTRSELLQSNAVATLYGERVLQSFSIIIPIAVMVSTLGSINNSIFSSSRIVFTAARDGSLPEYFSYINISQLTPFGAMTLQIILALLYLIPADLGVLISYTGFLTACFEACVFLSLIRFHFQSKKYYQRPLKIPVIIPMLMFLVNVYLIIAPVIIKPKLEYIYAGIGVPVAALVLYFTFVYSSLKFPFYDKIVTWLQLVLEICPPSESIKI